MSLRVVIACLGVMIGGFAGASLMAAEVSLAVKPVDRIPAGTRFGTQPPEGYSDIITFVEGRLASGDLDAVSDTVDYYAKIFNLVMLGNVKQDASGEYVLDKFEVGFSMVLNGQNVVVTSDTHRRLRSGLSFIGGSVLSGNEEALSDIKQVARTKNSMIVDAPTIMLRNGEHRKMTCRYALWAKPSGDGIGTAVWLLDDQGNSRGDYAIAEQTFQYLPANMREDRVMNVNGKRFTLGLPAKDAFALVKIPQGTPFNITPEMRANIGAKPLTADRYVQLWSSMAGAINQQSQQ